MSISTKKKILGIGILKQPDAHTSSYDPELVKQQVNDELARLCAAGFEVTLYFADSSKSRETTLSEVRQHLHNGGGPWDGVSIGFGLRGDVAYTALFEDIVNAVVADTTGGAGVAGEKKNKVPRFMFTSSTADIYDAAVRVLGT